MRPCEWRAKPESIPLDRSCFGSSVCRGPVGNKCTEDKVKNMLTTEKKLIQEEPDIQKKRSQNGFSPNKE